MSCPKEYFCELCNLGCWREELYKSHMDGKRHAEKAGIKPKCPEEYYCNDCSLACWKPEMYLRQYNVEYSTLHKRLANGMSVWTCDVCPNVKCYGDDYIQKHLSSKGHQDKVTKNDYDTNT